MKAVFVTMFVVNVVLVLASLAILPEEVASHFGMRGEPDSWMSKGAYAAFGIVVYSLLFLVFAFIAPITVRLPRWMINLPHKDYWLRPERRDELKRRLDGQMASVGTALFAFVFCVQILVLHANFSQPVRLHQPAFFAALGVFIIVTILLSIRMHRAFRVPGAEGG